MPIYNVNVTLECTMVVQADDEDHARSVSRDYWKQGVEDADAYPSFNITGEVTKEKHLRDGWDMQCLPYGGDGEARLSELIEPSPQ